MAVLDLHSKSLPYGLDSDSALQGCSKYGYIIHLKYSQIHLSLIFCLGLFSPPTASLLPFIPLSQLMLTDNFWHLKHSHNSKSQGCLKGIFREVSLPTSSLLPHSPFSILPISSHPLLTENNLISSWFIFPEFLFHGNVWFSHTLLSYRKGSILYTFFCSWLLFQLTVYPGDHSICSQKSFPSLFIYSRVTFYCVNMSQFI